MFGCHMEDEDILDDDKYVFFLLDSSYIDLGYRMIRSHKTRKILPVRTKV